MAHKLPQTEPRTLCSDCKTNPVLLGGTLCGRCWLDALRLLKRRGPS